MRLFFFFFFLRAYRYRELERANQVVAEVRSSAHFDSVYNIYVRAPTCLDKTDVLREALGSAGHRAEEQRLRALRYHYPMVYLAVMAQLV